MVLFLINPVQQLSKAKDGQRKEDFKQIREALDTYYNDYNCYPTTLPFGQEWKIRNTVYMKTVPQDPTCSNGGYCYNYMYDVNDACPQWNVVVGKLAVAPATQTPACLLEDSCLPQNYGALGYNLCDYGGNIDCSVLQSMLLSQPQQSTPIPSLSASPTSPVATGTPNTPTPSPQGSASVFYYCGCGAGHVTVCNISYTIPQGVQYYTDNACSNQCGQPC